VIGTPGYTRYHSEKKVKKFLNKIPPIKKLKDHKYLNGIFTATLTYEIHNAPGDYYRFSPQTYKEVFLQGCDDIKIQSVMLPPRIIGSGIKK